jgi:GR25 family glycosyltransferase involved in LPS biosynthesis
MFDIYVINLEERTDRWENITKIFKNFNLIKINAIKQKKGAIGCFLSHRECLKIAKLKKLQNIFIIEDDCTFYLTENNFDERLLKIKKILDNYNDWDIFLGGPNKVFSHDCFESICIDDENFVKATKGYAIHMICYNQKSYDFFLKIDPFSNIPIDKCWHDNLTALIPVPYIAIQIDSYSNIVNKSTSIIGRTKSSNDSLVEYVKQNIIIK